MLKLAEADKALQGARAQGDPALLVEALLNHAELAPTFRYRTVPVREELVEASRLLPPQRRPALEGRCLLRLSQVQMQEGMLKQAMQLAEQAAARFRLAGDPEGVFRAGCQRVRVYRRLDEPQQADRVLADIAGAITATDRAQSQSFTALALAIAEGQLENSDEEGIQTLKAMLNALDREQVEAFDARFAAHQGIALLAQVGGHPDQSLSHLRAVTALVRAHDAPMDLLECRLALGTALAAAKKMPEARRVLQVVIDEARDLQAEQHRLLGLTALSGVLSGQGAVRGAVDLALESANGYARQGNLLGYVRGATLAAFALLSHGREAGAVELLMYGVSALRHTLGESAAALLQAQLDAIRQEMGEEKYEAVCQEVLAVRAARKRVQDN